MSIDIVRGELERLFSLDEMVALSTDLLGFDPKEIGGLASKASFARALTDRCAEVDAVEALVDAVIASRNEVDPRVKEVAQKGHVRPEELKAGEALGPFTITRKIAEGPRAIIYAATKDGAEKTLKVFRRTATRDPSAVRRFLTYTRIAARVGHENLASDLEAGLTDGHLYVAYAPIDGQPLAARIAKTGPLHFNEAKSFLKQILAGLGALHEKKLAHGNLKLENVLIGRGPDGLQRPILVDVGGDRLGAFGFGSVVGNGSLVRSLSPEQIRGRLADPSSDLYAFGAVLFEILAGKPPFPGESALDVIMAHLTQPPPAPSSVAPRGWVGKEMDELAQRLLQKAPAERPKNAAAALLVIEPAALEQVKEGQTSYSDEELDTRVELLMTDPSDPDFALALESTIQQGADPTKVVEAFAMAVEVVADGDDDEAKAQAKDTKKHIFFRIARIYESVLKDLEQAEATYVQILEIDPEDDVAFASLERTRRALDKHDELIEMLLERSESSKSHSERARALNAIGHLYDDKEQSVFAFAQALAQDTQSDEYAVDLERSAGSDMKLWAESLQILSQATTHPRMPAEAKISLFTRLGRWYSEKIARPDLGLPCFQAVLSVDPANDGAMEGLAHLYRRAQQWEELSQVLLTRADRAPTPAQARDIRFEAAELFEKNLNDSGRARDLFEQIFEQDPSHTKASEALERIYHRLEDHKGLTKILERRVQALRGEARVETICKLAELFEDQLNDAAEAQRRYEDALEADPQNLTALRGLDRIFNRSGRYKELIANLEKQIAISATPRQKINLYERLAGIYDEEFLDHAKAAEALEAIHQIDSAHEAAITALIRHYRVLDRWEDVVNLYEKHLRIVTDEKRRVELLLAEGRVLVEQIGSPERARKVYERVLEIDPHHAGALESLAHVRAATGDAMAALSAIESLAAKATTPENKADLWLRAAKILDDHGDKDGAIERYKAALDAQPANAVATTALRAAYLARGDATSAVELLGKTIEVTEGNLSKARLYGEMAQLLRDRLKDADRSKEAATKAVDLDPTNILGLTVLGDFAFEAERFLEASKSYESVANRVDALGKEEGPRLLIRYVDALSKSGSTEKAIGTVQTLLTLAPDNPDAISRAAKVNLDAKKPKEAATLYADLLKRFGESLSIEDKFEASLRLGEARLAAGDADGAVEPLNDAADLMPESPLPINALCKVFEAKKDWEEVIRQKTRRLDVVTGDERSAILLEIGEILATQINDRTRAAKTFVAALDERPDDRRILTKLMQLYSEEKDWGKLVEIVLKLASKVDDKKQKSKYLHTAAIVSWRQLGEVDKALEFYDQVLELDPTLDRPLAEAIELRTEKGDHEGVERLLQVELERATESNDTAKMLQTFEKLAVLYKEKLNWMSDAIDAYEAAQTLDPDNLEREEVLAQLYVSDPANYFDKAVAAQEAILKRNPYKPEPYKTLRKLFTEGKKADAAWCTCQALFCMNIAEPDEERFFKRMRAEGPAAAVDRLSEDDWFGQLMHEDSDPLLTEIFAVIQPAVLRKNGQSLEALGYQLAYKLDLTLHPYPMSQTLNYAAGVLGMEAPMTFQNPNDPGGVQFLHAYTPSIVLGSAALAPDLPTQAAAFIAARHLTYYRPGLYLRHLVPTGTGLRAWLFAAIKMVSPTFPIAKEIEAQVRENQNAIEPTVVGPARELLVSAVTKLLQAGAIDLKKWVVGVDLTADRAGFVLANDLELAQEMIKAADEGSAALPQKERLKELTLFGVNEKYFAIRRRIGVNIDA
ncbi:MAG TPA: tetratricopeptide repeat protein [Polyangiaceae bacterium]|nr:tetratricopeptide repeat protein [Polyangiaceae bacterium]